MITSKVMKGNAEVVVEIMVTIDQETAIITGTEVLLMLRETISSSQSGSGEAGKMQIIGTGAETGEHSYVVVVVMMTTTGTIIVKEVTEEATIVTTGREIAADISE